MNMTVYAYCAESMRGSVLASTGVEPDTCPSVSSETFMPTKLLGRDVVVLKLHGDFDGIWYGDDWKPALSVAHFSGHRMHGTVIIAQTCYMPASPFLPAMLATGASVVGGNGTNSGGYNIMVGSDWLVKYMLAGLDAGLSVQGALRYAKVRVLLRGPTKENRDALGFQLYGG